MIFGCGPFWKQGSAAVMYCWNLDDVIYTEMPGVSHFSDYTKTTKLLAGQGDWVEAGHDQGQLHFS